jgi:Golgi SNAP receptor complex protein 1
MGLSLIELLFSSDTTPLLNGSSQDRMFETMAIEIEQLLARVSDYP